MNDDGEIDTHCSRFAAALAVPETSGTLEDGTPLAPAATDRPLCDAAVVEMIEDSAGT